MGIWLQVTAGQGPAECQWVVQRLLNEIEQEANAQRLQVELLEAVPGEERDTLKSALLSVEGENSAAFAETWAGTIQWVGKSPFRPHHQRKNWFVGVDAIAVPQEVKWSPSELQVETMRSSGPGGQHVNKTSSAVRLTHLPTGLTVIAREERSQQKNRKLALARLAQLFQEQQQQAEQGSRTERWQQHGTLERGNAVRVYTGENFRRKS